MKAGEEYISANMTRPGNSLKVQHAITITRCAKDGSWVDIHVVSYLGGYEHGRPNDLWTKRQPTPLGNCVPNWWDEYRMRPLTCMEDAAQALAENRKP